MNAIPPLPGILHALGDIRPSHLGDPNLFDFLGLGKRGSDNLPGAHVWLAGDATQY